MKKLFYPLILCAAVAAVVGCKKDAGEKTSYKLEVSPRALNFEATGAAAQTVTVTAENVEWEVVKAAEATWVTVTTDEANSTISVSVDDNTAETERTAQIQVAPVANDSVEAKTITVTQAAGNGEGGDGGDEDLSNVTMKLSANNAKFAGAGETVEITVTFEGTDRMLPFTVTPDDPECDWLTIEINEGVIALTAGLNDNTVSRSALLTVKPESDQIGAKKISVSQEAGAVSKIEPTIFFPLNFRWDETTEKQLMVTLIGLETFVASAVNEDGSACDWVNLRQKHYMEGKYYLYVSVDNNMEEVARTATIILEAGEGEPAATPVELTVTQEAGKKGLSTLTGDEVLPTFATVNVSVTPYMDPTSQATSPWNFTMYTDGLSMNVWGKYVGTGTLLRFTLEGPSLPFDPDEENYSYTLADGDYVGVPRVAYGEQAEPFTFAQGDNGGINASAWVAYYENDAITKQAPLFGSITTKNTGENSYEITFNLTDDLGHTITGSWSGTFSKLRELGMREPGGWDGGGSVDDDFGDVTPEL